MYKLKRFFNAAHYIIIALVVGLASCTTTSYKFTPPDSPSGRMCINECLRNRSVCRTNCDTIKMQYDAMHNISNTISATKKSDAVVTKTITTDRYGTQTTKYYYPVKESNPKPSLPDYNSSLCYERCEDDYRACYQNCGGNVETVVVDPFKNPNPASPTSHAHTNSPSHGTLSSLPQR